MIAHCRGGHARGIACRGNGGCHFRRGGPCNEIEGLTTLVSADLNDEGRNEAGRTGSAGERGADAAAGQIAVQSLHRIGAGRGGRVGGEVAGGAEAGRTVGGYGKRVDRAAVEHAGRGTPRWRCRRHSAWRCGQA